MKFIGCLITVCVLVLVLIGNSFSAIIELKNGRIVTGTILKQTDNSVKVLLKSGDEVIYHNDEISRIQTVGDIVNLAVNPKKVQKEQKKDFGFLTIDIESVCHRFFSKKNIGSLRDFLREKICFISERMKNLKFAKLKDNEEKKKKTVGVEKSIEKAVQKSLKRVDARISKIFDDYTK